ncbi:MAG: Abortive infection bacteriophage resistance protein [Actinomyces urogenitalis DORA_12]|uniref:Abortive infection bacteriophage resistance protein n=2 Tax=Actinomyces urogenitalis DORA_12 TaxID=1403939 RepID=W1V6F2_9ACTO|nr:Abi family protein [uncultured Actinomyces sp.]ETJ01231.1 MAG: Abortive infection bacteriophage resistance protein [Actinomyces urogenitalis DORA_12]MBS6415439.1 Abi family protein [Mycobacteriales bacterium]MDU7428195.1 Abi family protein [Actinomyces urogenitalis]
MPTPKTFLTYAEQVDLLRSRGLLIHDQAEAEHCLEHINYYRLSGYWYPLRQIGSITERRLDSFLPGSSFDQVLALYEFDLQLRTSVFEVLSAVELTFRALLGHELGRIAPLIHMDPSRLGPLARHRTSNEPSPEYNKWLNRYHHELSSSREIFVSHYKKYYDSQLPVWAAVEIMDFGSLTHLYRLAPDEVRENIAVHAQLNAAQLGSWMKSLNIVRNYAAHHARMFNRVYALKPRMPRVGQDASLDAARGVMNRCFGQLTMIQYLLRAFNLDGLNTLPTLLATYPHTIPAVPINHVGAPPAWNELDLWKVAANSILS